MDDEQIWGAACAGSDLTARLWADLARANECMAIANARLDAAMGKGLPAASLRAAARACRRQVRSLLRVLSGMPGFHGGEDALALGA